MSVWYSEKWKGWMYKFRKNRVTYEATGFKTKSAAQKAEREKRNTLEEQEKSRTRSISFLRLSTLYLEHCAATYGKNTIRYKTQYIRAFLKTAINEEHLAAQSKNGDEVKRPPQGRKSPEVPKLPAEMQVSINVPAEDIPRPVFEKFLDTVAVEHGRKLSNRHLRDLKALYNWAARSDYLDVNPLKHIQPKGEDKQSKYVPPPSDVKAVLLAASQEEMDIILAVYATGARISEIRRLTWDDVNIENNSITLWTRKRKGGGLEADTVNMTLKLQDTMKRRWKIRDRNVPYVFHREDGSRYTRDTHFMKKFMPRLCKRAGVQPFGFHGIRHLVARILADSGKANLREIQHFLRHHRATTTDTYLKELQPGSKVAAGILDCFDIDEVNKQEKGENNKDS